MVCAIFQKKLVPSRLYEYDKKYDRSEPRLDEVGQNKAKIWVGVEWLTELEGTGAARNWASDLSVVESEGNWASSNGSADLSNTNWESSNGTSRVRVVWSEFVKIEGATARSNFYLWCHVDLNVLLILRMWFT